MMEDVVPGNTSLPVKLLMVILGRSLRVWEGVQLEPYHHSRCRGSWGRSLAPAALTLSPPDCGGSGP